MAEVIRTSAVVHADLDALRTAFRLTRQEVLLEQIRALIAEVKPLEEAEMLADIQSVRRAPH